MPIISKITGAPFRFWCQKVLPAVYDDSLSYYELLCKVVDYLNKLMEDDINVINLVNENETNFNTLKEYVDTYFENLDVQEEINNKLDEMATDGTLMNIIRPYIDDIFKELQEKNLEQDNSISLLEQDMDVFTDNDPLNVLLLGVKNDGSEDCSSIINEATKTHSLYFPAGLYRVDSEIRAVHSIYGCGYNRRYNVDPTYSTFVSNIQTTDPNDCVIRIVGHGSQEHVVLGITIKGIDVKLHSDESGIIVETIDHEAIMINETGVKDVANSYGIWCKPVNNTSRLMFVDNCTIYGAKNYPNSVGVYLDDGASDCRITNTEILGTKKGIWQRTSILYLANCHIWTGCRNERDENDWWSDTVCLDCSTNAISSVTLVGTNLYLDSAHHYIETWRGATINLTNTIVWMDGSMAGSNSYNGKLLDIRGQVVERSVYFCGLIGYFGDRISSIFAHGARYENIKLILSNNDDFVKYSDENRFPLTSYIEEQAFKFRDENDANVYVEIARGLIDPGCHLNFSFKTFGDDVEFYINADDNGVLSVLINRLRGTANFYYTYDQVNHIFKIFRYKHDSGVLHCLNKIIDSSESCGLLDYSAIRVYQRTTLNDDYGLTQIVNLYANTQTYILTTTADLNNLISHLSLNNTSNFYINASLMTTLTNSNVTSAFKGTVTKISANAIDFVGGSGGDLYVLRVNASGTATMLTKAQMSSII